MVDSKVLIFEMLQKIYFLDKTIKQFKQSFADTKINEGESIEDYIMRVAKKLE